MRITEEMVEHCKHVLWDTMEAFVAEASKEKEGEAEYEAQTWEEGDEEERKVTEVVVRTVLTEALPLWAAEFAKELQGALAQLPTEAPRTEMVRMMATDEFGYFPRMRTIRVHAAIVCKGHYCTIHNPSEHHMAGWPQLWRDDEKKMERTCPHGTGHPDPDEINPNTIHGCDGCCAPQVNTPPEVDEFLEGLTPGVRRVRHQGVSREVTDVVAPMLVDPWMER